VSLDCGVLSSVSENTRMHFMECHFGCLGLCIEEEGKILGGETSVSQKDEMKSPEEIVKLKEKYEVDDLMRDAVRGNGFKNAEVKTNVIQILKEYGIDDVKSLR
jgi:hypothetical protein